MADLSTLQTRLAEAEAARHDLMSGGRPTTVRYSDGSEVQFGQMTLADVDAYIKRLQAEILQAQQGFRRRPFFVEFGR